MSLGVFSQHRGRRAPLGAAPTQWQKDARVVKLQELLNAEMGRLSCTAFLSTDGIIGPGTCGALKFVSDAGRAGFVLSPELQSFWQTHGQDMVAGCNAVGTTKAPACPPYQAAAAGITEDEVWMLQRRLNDELLTPKGFVKLVNDGKLTKETCGAASYAVAQKTAGTFKPSSELADLLGLSALQRACDPLYPWVAPKSSAPPPTTAPVTSADILTTQKLLNSEVLGPHGLEKVLETGKLDPLTCGAMSAVYGDVVRGNVTVSSTLLSKLKNTALVEACAAHKPWVTPQPRPGAAPAPVVAPAPAPAPTRTPTAPSYEQCWMNYGDKTTAVKELQQLINTRLGQKGYRPITVSGKYDAATCGAITTLKDDYDKWAVKSCPAGPVVPLRCPKSTNPTRKAPARRAIATRPAPVKRASMVGPVIVAGIVASVAYVYAQKKGLIG